jgi:hypothetical protein
VNGYRTNGVIPKASSATAWVSWDSYMKRRSPVLQPTSEEQKMFSGIGASITACSVNYKPKLGAALVSHDAGSFKQVKKVSPISADLHEKLEALGLEELKNVLGKPDLKAGSISFTTTDLNAGICITGCITNEGTKTANVALVVTETERHASWSRLEGLILHWACTYSKGSAWSMPPHGWTSVPDKNTDAGGAVNTSFEKHVDNSQQSTYVLVLKLPLEGILASGGITFVLKACDAQNTKWLKDASTDKDFYVDLQGLPSV